MAKRISANDVAFVNQKYNFQQDLEYLPLTFKQEADQFLHDQGIQRELYSARETYIDLVTYFEA